MSTTSGGKSPGRQKHVPQRTCIGCRQVKAKRELIRIVRMENGVEIDTTGKKSGRGAYLCQARSCWEAALKQEHLARALKTRLTTRDKEVLANYAGMLP